MEIEPTKINESANIEKKILNNSFAKFKRNTFFNQRLYAVIQNSVIYINFNFDFFLRLRLF